MTFQRLTRIWIPGIAILCLSSNQARCDEPEAQVTPVKTVNAERSINCARSASDGGKCEDEAAVACPCADEYAAAIAAYNARSGAPVTEWLRCDDTIAGTGGLIAYSTKPDPTPPSWVTVILIAKGRWGYGHGIARLCEAWNYEGLAGDWGRPPLGTPTHGRHSKLSEGEVLACERLIRATALCTNQAQGVSHE